MERDRIEKRGAPTSTDWIIDSHGQGSPVSDHDRARELIEVMAQSYEDGMRAALGQHPAVKRRRWWTTVSHEVHSCPGRRPSLAMRDGHQPRGARNIRAYLLWLLLDMSDSEIAADLRMNSRQNARKARLRGKILASRLQTAFA